MHRTLTSSQVMGLLSIGAPELNHFVVNGLFLCDVRARSDKKGTLRYFNQAEVEWSYRMYREFTNFLLCRGASEMLAKSFAVNMTLYVRREFERKDMPFDYEDPSRIRQKMESFLFGREEEAIKWDYWFIVGIVLVIGMFVVRALVIGMLVVRALLIG